MGFRELLNGRSDGSSFPQPREHLSNAEPVVRQPAGQVGASGNGTLGEADKPNNAQPVRFIDGSLFGRAAPLSAAVTPNDGAAAVGSLMLSPQANAQIGTAAADLQAPDATPVAVSPPPSADATQAPETIESPTYSTGLQETTLSALASSAGAPDSTTLEASVVTTQFIEAGDVRQVAATTLKVLADRPAVAVCPQPTTPARTGAPAAAAKRAAFSEALRAGQIARLGSIKITPNGRPGESGIDLLVRVGGLTAHEDDRLDLRLRATAERSGVVVGDLQLNGVDRSQSTGN
jgi:hypothetical protein